MEKGTMFGCDESLHTFCCSRIRNFPLFLLLLLLLIIMIYLYRKENENKNGSKQHEWNTIGNAIEPVVGMAFVFTFFCSVLFVVVIAFFLSLFDI